MALGDGPGVRVVAVEADPAECSRLQRTLAGNDGHSRALLLNAFVGGDTDFQIGLKSADRCAPVPNLTQQELLSKIGPDPLDLIKCDIEGSEFALLADSAPLFASARQIAMELHPRAGNPDVVIDRLRQMGFEVRSEIRPPTIILRARRGATPSPTKATGGP